MAQQNRFTSALKNLVLALLNATIMLILLCLVFAYLTARQINGLTDTMTTAFAENLITVEPVKEQLVLLNDNVTGLRSDVQAIRTATGAVRDEKLEAIQIRLDTMATNTADMRNKMRQITEEPDVIVGAAVSSAVGELTETLVALRGCAPLSLPDDLTLPVKN